MFEISLKTSVHLFYLSKIWDRHPNKKTEEEMKIRPMQIHQQRLKKNVFSNWCWNFFTTLEKILKKKALNQIPQFHLVYHQQKQSPNKKSHSTKASICCSFQKQGTRGERIKNHSSIRFFRQFFFLSEHEVRSSPDSLSLGNFDSTKEHNSKGSYVKRERERSKVFEDHWEKV